MSLRRKILVKDLALLAGLMAIVAGCLWGLLRQRQHVQASLTELSALRQIESAQSHLSAFEQNIRAGQITSADAQASLRAAFLEMRGYKASVLQYDNILPPEVSYDLRTNVRVQTNQILADLQNLADLTNPSQAHTPDSAVIGPQADQLVREVATLLSTCNGFVDRTELASEQDLRTASIWVAAIAILSVVGSLIASLWQHRRITVPLERLRQWCRRAAGRDFSVAYQPTGDLEFQELAKDVNKMAVDLDAFYRKLEEMVAAKSRELVRSERLASIGYLAAGVAHEINTPLNVMCGYAELSLRRLAQANEESRANGNLVEHLSIIRGEAFRCKEITQKLLSLTRGSGGERASVDVAATITDVANMVRGLDVFRRKQLKLNAAPSPELFVWANATELKQVLLNLMINAVEAVAAGDGEVNVGARRSNGFVELAVSDNGRGMTESVREKVFEPFFTDKRGSGEPGTGLGLSVTHAIVTEHGGKIDVHSDGPGRGSRFTVWLRAAKPAEAGKTADGP